jgi:hypothetical protein
MAGGLEPDSVELTLDYEEDLAKIAYKMIGLYGYRSFTNAISHNWAYGDGYAFNADLSKSAPAPGIKTWHRALSDFVAYVATPDVSGNFTNYGAYAFTIQYVGAGGQCELRITANKLQIYVDGVLATSMGFHSSSYNTITKVRNALSSAEITVGAVAASAGSLHPSCLFPVQSYDIKTVAVPVYYLLKSAATNLRDELMPSKIVLSIERGLKSQGGAYTANGITVYSASAGLWPQKADVTLKITVPKFSAKWPSLYEAYCNTPATVPMALPHFFIDFNSTYHINLGPCVIAKSPESKDTEDDVSNLELVFKAVGGNCKASTMLEA